MRKWEKNLSGWLVLACAALFYLPLGLRALWDSDEGRYAEIAREMLALKDWITPHLNYVVYFEKPPLMYWLTALSLRLLGPSAFAARFWCATFGLLTVWVTCQWGKNWKNERVGLLAGGMLATSLGFFALTQFLVLDMALTFWTTLILLAGSGLLVERSTSRARRLLYLLSVAIAGGILTKGPVAFVLPAAALAAVYFSQGRRLTLPRLPWHAAIALCALLTLPWFILVTLQHPIFPYFFLVHEHFQRYLTDIHHRTAPFYFFIPVILVGFLPWSVFLPRVFQTWFSHRHAALKRDPEGAVLVTWVLWVFVFFSLSHSKLVGYVLPIFPALALLVAYEFDLAMDDGEPGVEALMPSWVGRGIAALIFIFFLGLLVLKLPPDMLSIDTPQWKIIVDQSAVLALVLGFAVFVLVGVWGMRQTLACVGGVMLAQVLLLTTAASLAPTLDPYQSTRAIAERFQERTGPEAALIAYGANYENVLQTLPFYLGRRIPVFGPPGELTMGLETEQTDESWYVPEDKAQSALLAMPPGTWGITDEEHWQALRQAAPPDSFHSVNQTGGLLLFRKDH